MKGTGGLAGRAGSRFNNQSYYLFVLQDGSDEMDVENLRFISFSKTPRIFKPNKSQLILASLRKNVDRAFYTSPTIDGADRFGGIRVLSYLDSVACW